MGLKVKSVFKDVPVRKETRGDCTGRAGIRRQCTSEPSEGTGEEVEWKLPRPLFSLLKG